jgi:hypothetical protein
MSHTITLEELDDYLAQEAWDMAASSSGNGSMKRLEVNNAGALRVTDHGEIKYIGSDKSRAVDAYNAAP